MKTPSLAILSLFLIVVPVLSQPAQVNPTALFLRGIERYQRGDLPGAREDFDRLLAIDPQSA